MLRSNHQLKKISAIVSISSLLILSGWQSSFAQSNLVYVILYNPKSNNEGIYSIQNEKIETILIFNSETAAKRYASQLKIPKTPQPKIEAIDPNEILSFCRNRDYICQFIPQGVEVIPPTENVTPSKRGYRS